MSARFKPAAVFGDRMVLRRDRPALIFGEAAGKATINAEISGKCVKTTAREGRFELALPPMPAGGPYTLTLSAGETKITYTDVLFGEVYFAGGQSNMEWPLSAAADGPRLAAAANHPQIRYYNVPKQPVLNGKLLAAERKARWRALEPGLCGDMSAVAFHFATLLQAELNVPVGVIDCYWGGTSVACWLSEQALRGTAAGAALLTEFEAKVGGRSDAECEVDVRENEEALKRWERQVERARAEHPGADWHEIAARLDPCPWNPPASRRSGFRPSGLAETMVKRVAPYTLTGFLYYQGEEDTRHPGLYRPLMTALIAFWRDLFRDGALPFLFVQLPMFRNSNEADDRQWAVLREAQEQACMDTRNAGLAVMIDDGELDNIHPTEKKTVGLRLYYEALRVAYGRPDVPESPRALYAYREGEEMVIRLSAPVAAQGTPRLCELMGADGAFVSAEATVAGDTLRLRAPGVAEPLKARYAWVNYGVVNVFGENGLPLAPFLIG